MTEVVETVKRKRGGSKPGERRGGRAKGTPNRISLTVKDSVLEAFKQLGGVTHMVAWAKENPSDFYKIAAKLIPTQITADITTHEAEDMSDAELLRIAATGSERADKAKGIEKKSSSVH